MDVDPTVPLVKSLLLLDSEGKRLAVKYYSPEWSTVSAQASYEKSVFAKTKGTSARGEAEITLFDDVVVVYKTLGDVTFYVTGSQDENELILYNVLQAFYESVSLLLRGVVEKKTVLENLDCALLAIDEIIERGLILELDATIVASRVSMRGAETDMPFTEQSFSKVFTSAREQITRSLLK